MLAEIRSKESHAARTLVSLGWGSFYPVVLPLEDSSTCYQKSTRLMPTLSSAAGEVLSHGREQASTVALRYCRLAKLLFTQ